MVHIPLDKICLYWHPNVTYSISYGFCANVLLCPTVFGKSSYTKAIMPTVCIETFVMGSKYNQHIKKLNQMNQGIKPLIRKRHN